MGKQTYQIGDCEWDYLEKIEDKVYIYCDGIPIGVFDIRTQEYDIAKTAVSVYELIAVFEAKKLLRRLKLDYG